MRRGAAVLRALCWRRLALGVAASCLLCGASAGAQSSGLPSRSPDGALGFDDARVRAAETRDRCQEITSAAASESAALRWPLLFSRVGLMRGSPLDVDGGGGAARRDLLWNLQVGAEVSPTRIYEAGLVEARARAECDRYAAELSFRALMAAFDLDLTKALEARIQSLQASLPDAERRLEASSSALDGSQVSLPDHLTTRRRVDRLRQQLADAELDLASAPLFAAEPAPPAGRAFDELRRAEARVVALDAELRRADSIALSLRAGYDEVFGVEQSLPVFAFVSLRLAPARLWQRAHDAASERAHQRRVERRIEQARLLLERLEGQLGRQLTVLERRLAQLERRIAELGRRQSDLGGVGTQAAGELSEALWFERAEVEADRAYAYALRDTLERRRRELIAGRLK